MKIRVGFEMLYDFPQRTPMIMVLGTHFTRASDIIVRLAVNSLHFVQSFREGPLYITTVIARQTKNGRWLAVHTRHEYAEIDLPGFTSKPEQYYGSCVLE